MFKEQNVNAIIGILWGLAVYFNLSNLDPMTLNVLAIWAVSINRLYRHFNKGKKKSQGSVMSDIENLTSTAKSSVFDYKQYEAIELNYSYLGEECLAEWRENLIKLRVQFQD